MCTLALLRTTGNKKAHKDNNVEFKKEKRKDPKMVMLMKRVFCPLFGASDISTVLKLVLTICSWFSFPSP